MAAPEKCPRAQVSTAKIAARTVMEPKSMVNSSCEMSGESYKSFPSGEAGSRKRD